MNVGAMKDKILVLSPDGEHRNSLNEVVPAWVPFNPYKCIKEIEPVLYVTEGLWKPEFAEGKSIRDLNAYMIWASVAPTSGREYEEAQKLRAETTYKIRVRWSPEFKSDLKILYREKILHIESVLDLEGKKREIELVCWEADSYGKAD